jgi:F-box and WD-40 domain protein CDC4
VNSQVWSFSPPEEVLSERSASLPGRPSDNGKRPMSAILPEFRTVPTPLSGLSRRDDSDDVDMVDAGPSTAPVNKTFFHDD